MAHVPLPDADTTAGHAREVLLGAERRWGFAPNIVRALALCPDILAAEDQWSRAVMYGGRLPRHLKEAVATVVSSVNRTPYCIASHAMAARREGLAPQRVEACQALHLEEFPEAERAALDFARRAAADAHAITARDVEALRAHYDPEQVVELAAVVASFMMYNTFVTVLGIELEPVHAAGSTDAG